MDWYSVVKTINGRPYLYRQRTWREGGKVRTESQYVGAFGGDGHGGGQAVARSIEQEQEHVENTLEGLDLPDPTPSTTTAEKTTTKKPTVRRRGRPPRKPPVEPSQTFKSRAALYRVNVSEKALIEEERRALTG